MYYVDVNKVRIRRLGALRDVVFLFFMNRYINSYTRREAGGGGRNYAAIFCAPRNISALYMSQDV